MRKQNSYAREVKYMYTKEKYNRDLMFIEKIDHLISQKIEYLTYFVGFSACLIAHIVYLALFAATGITAMAIFNIFSVIFYASTIILVKKLKDKSGLVYTTLLEIVVHASTATICVGWDPDFGMFLLMIIPIAFLMPNKNKKFPFIIMAISIFLYAVLRFLYLNPENSVYSFEKNSYNNVFYVINILSDSFILVYFTTIYTIINRYTECMLRV